MKLSIVSTLSIAMLALAFSGCSSSTGNTNSNTAVVANTTNSNAANKPAETNKPAANTGSDAATGDVIKIDDAGIMMTVPKGFKFSKDGDDTIVMTEDEGVEVRFNVPSSGDYEAAVKDAAKELDEYITDVKITQDGETGTQDGMELTSSSGTGKDADGKDIIWDLTIIKTPKKPVLAISYAEKSSMEKHGADLKKFFESIKKQ